MLVKFNFRIATSIILGCALWWKIVISCDSVNYLNHLRFMHKVLFWIIPRFSFFLQKNVANNFSGSSISSVMSVYPLKFIDFFLLHQNTGSSNLAIPFMLQNWQWHTSVSMLKTSVSLVQMFWDFYTMHIPI